MQRWTCSWVPGTQNRVRVIGTRGTTETDSIETTVDRLVRVVGAPILNDLYLKGRATITAENLGQRLAS